MTESVPAWINDSVKFALSEKTIAKLAIPCAGIFSLIEPALSGFCNASSYLHLCWELLRMRVTMQHSTKYE